MYADTGISCGTDIRSVMLRTARVTSNLRDGASSTRQSREFVGNVCSTDTPRKIPREGNRFITYMQLCVLCDTNATDLAAYDSNS